MPRKQNMAFYQSLDFFYEQNYIATQLTDEPTGRLDPQAYLAGKNRCWRATGSFKQLHQRLIKLNLNHYSTQELTHILQEKFKLPTEKADELTSEYSESRDFSKKQRLFPPPNPRTLFKAAKHGIDSDESKPKKRK